MKPDTYAVYGFFMLMCSGIAAGWATYWRDIRAACSALVALAVFFFGSFLRNTAVAIVMSSKKGSREGGR